MKWIYLSKYVMTDINFCKEDDVTYGYCNYKNMKTLLAILLLCKLLLNLKWVPSQYNQSGTTQKILEWSLVLISVLELERGRLVRSEGIEMPDEIGRSGRVQAPWVLQLDKIMYKEMKESIGNEYIRRVKLIYKSNLNAVNFISDMNAWAIGVMRYNKEIIDLTKEELQDMERKTRKITTLNRCLHPRSSVARLYMKWKEGGRGIISVEDGITTERRG